MNAGTRHATVCIVGAGPTGLALALDLGRRGVDVLVVDKRELAAERPPTANHLGVRAMETLRRWGLADEARHTGLPDHGDDRIWLTRLGGAELYRIERPGNERAPELPYSPETEVWCPKHVLDPIIERAALDQRSVTLLSEHRVTAVHPADEGATVVAASPVGPRHISARWVVAADGARSDVRNLAGIAVRGAEIPVVLQSVDFRSRRLKELLPPGGTQYTLVDTNAMIVVIDPVDRFRLHVPSIGGAELTRENAAAELARLTGHDLEPTIRSVLPWQLRSAVADRWVDGPIVLAGDAGKQSTPFGGLGMNYGLVDAATLGWMLTAIDQGWGDPTLVAAYAIERRAAAVRLLTYQGLDLTTDPPTMTTRLAPPPVPARLRDHTDEGVAARASYGAALARHHRGHFDNVGVDLDQRASASPIVVPDGTAEPAWSVSGYEPMARPGHRAPHAWLAPGESTLDRFDASFVLCTDRAAIADGFATAATALGIPLAMLDRTLGGDTVLVRPDGIVAWRDRGDDPTAVLAAVTGYDTAHGRSRAGDSNP